MANREKIGAIFIDTATVIVAEPCYVIPEPGETPLIDWQQWCDQWHEQGEDVTDTLAVMANRMLHPLAEKFSETRRLRAKLLRLPPSGDPPRAIVVPTRENCDGWAHVYLERDAKGQPLRLIVDLTTKVEP